MRLLASVPKLVGSSTETLERLLAGRAGRVERVDPAVAEVRPDVPTVELGQPGVAHDDAARDRAARLAVRVLPHRWRDRRRLAGGRQGHLVRHRRAFLARPAEVRAELRERQLVDLLACSLADIADHHRVQLGVDPEPPRVPQAVGDDLGPGAGRRDEWVGGWDRIGRTVSRVDAKNAAEEIGQRLSGDTDRHPRRVGPAVTDGDVKVAVGPELHHAAVVVGGLLGQGDQQPALGAVDRVGIGGRAAILDHPDVPVPVVEVRVDETARRVVGRERDREEPLLAFADDDAAQVEERIRLHDAVLDQRHEPVLLHDQQPRGVARR